MSAKNNTKTGPKGIPAPKPRAVAAAATVAVVSEPAPETAAEETSAGKSSSLKLRELVTRVVDATGAKKKGVREIVEATLVQLGEALSKGEELNLPGVGKVRVARASDQNGRAVMTLKVRSASAPKKKEPKEALAATEEAV